MCVCVIVVSRSAGRWRCKIFFPVFLLNLFFFINFFGFLCFVFLCFFFSLVVLFCCGVVFAFLLSCRLKGVSIILDTGVGNGVFVLFERGVFV